MDKKEYFTYLNNRVTNNRIDKLEEFAMLNNVPIIQKSGLDFISMIIKISNAKKILEIGTAIGYSSINFALLDNMIHITSIERDEKMFNQAFNNINAMSLEDRIQLIYGDALLIDETSLPKDFDILFIDAAKSQYQKFFEKYTKCLKKGGVVITDNLIFHDLIFDEDIKNRNTKQLVNKIKKYNDWIKNNDAFDTSFFDIGDGISISIKK